MSARRHADKNHKANGGRRKKECRHGMVIMSITIRPSILSTKTMLEAPLILNASKNNLLSVMWHRQRTQICGMVM
jgi:flagellar assembly factor FliW